MPGSREGGRKAAETNRRKYGEDFFKRIGKVGGAKSNTGGFATTKRDANGRDGRERARVFGKVGGQNSRRS